MERRIGFANRLLGALEAKQGIDVRDELVRVDRLGQVAARPGGQSGQLALEGHRRRRHLQHQHVRRRRILLDLPAHLEAGDVGQVDIEQHELRLMRADELQRF